MKLAHMTWQEVDALARDVVVVIPTGSLEQHGPHLPLFTDSILVTAVAEAVEAAISDNVLLTPTHWLGASAHHLAFAGSLTASFPTYMGAIDNVVESLAQHAFKRFYVLNGHGGNEAPNNMVLRELKSKHPNLTFACTGYYTFADAESAETLTGPTKSIQHACEAEASLMMHVKPELVRKEQLRDDGLSPQPTIKGLITHFDEITEEGSLGYATYASPAKGKRLFDACVAGATENILNMANGHVFVGH